jgi:Spy/CpxP family protein refolding chaperone
MINPIAWFLVLLMCETVSWAAEKTSPYAGPPSPEMKALSATEVESYLTGSGMGLAKVAELHHYPGPRHVLDLADRLDLTAEQVVKTQEIYHTMHTEAVRLGQFIVEKERLLDSLFAAQTITEARLQELVREIAQHLGALRIVHLKAHLAQRALLTPEQIRQYDELRGYTTAVQDRHQHGHTR